jgi:hypothetical protein
MLYRAHALDTVKPERIRWCNANKEALRICLSRHSTYIRFPTAFVPSVHRCMYGRIRDKSIRNTLAQLFGLFYVSGSHLVEVDRSHHGVLDVDVGSFVH